MSELSSVNSIPPGERLALSRQRLQRFLNAGSGKSAAPAAAPGEEAGADTPGWLRSMRTAQALADAALRPVAQTHPLPTVGVALLAGAYLAWARPWRGLLQPALIAGITAQIATRLIARVPVANLVDIAASLLAPRKPRP